MSAKVGKHSFPLVCEVANRPFLAVAWISQYNGTVLEKQFRYGLYLSVSQGYLSIRPLDGVRKASFRDDRLAYIILYKCRRIPL